MYNRYNNDQNRNLCPPEACILMRGGRHETRSISKEHGMWVVRSARKKQIAEKEREIGWNRRHLNKFRRWGQILGGGKS